MGCPVEQGERYGDCLTYGPGHYETWTHWRRDRTVEPALRAIVQAYEYEDWPRGRIVFDHHLRRLQAIETQFHLPEKRTEVTSDWHYQSTETRDQHPSTGRTMAYDV